MTYLDLIMVYLAGAAGTGFYLHLRAWMTMAALDELDQLRKQGIARPKEKKARLFPLLPLKTVLVLSAVWPVYWLLYIVVYVIT